MAKMNPSKLRDTLEAVKTSGLSSTKKDAVCTLINRYLNGDIRPVLHGHWIVDEDGNIKCSECGHRGVGDNYCERCGAKMDGERREDETD